MVQDYSVGGLKMVDTRAYIDALNITWLRRLLVSEGSAWSFLAQVILGTHNLTVLEGGSFRFPANNRFYVRNQFWADVLNSWHKFTSCHKPTTHRDVLKSSLWFNDLVKVGNKCIFYRHWVSAGVLYICDILDDKGKFLSLNSFKDKFNVRTNFIEYGAVVKAVKCTFQDKLQTQNRNVNCPFIPFNFEVLLRDKRGSKRFLQIFISSKKFVRKYAEKWNNKLHIDYNLSQWSSVFKVSFSCTTDTKLRWFQFRLIHRILGTNLFLFKINKADSNTCTFCKTEEESLIHLFCSCTYSGNFWSSLVSWIKDKTHISLHLDNQTILFGNINVTSDCLNSILLCARFHIYKTKMNNKFPSILVFKKEVKQHYVCAKYLSIVNCENRRFSLKWDFHSKLFQE